MVYVLILLAFVLLNRLRGNKDYLPFLPSRMLFWVAPIITLIACVVLPWQNALIFGAGYLFWGFFEWGRWFDLGNIPELERPKKPLERAIDAISFGSDYVAMTIRMAFAGPFVAYFNIGYAVAFPFIATALYALAWRIWHDNPIPKAELMVGALWGLILIGAA